MAHGGAAGHVGGVTSFAITSGGTTAITSEGSTRFISPEGQLIVPSKPLEFEQVASAGDQIYGWNDSGLFVSTDADLVDVWVRVDGDDYL